MLYVAYGSNINPEQMEYRVPGAMYYGTGVINNWRLAFHGKDGNGYATIVQDHGNTVPVVLWEMTKFQEMVMDTYEGYPKSYYKKKIAVYVGGVKKFGVVYIMNDQRRVARPSRKYVNTVRNGYLHYGLPTEYLDDALAKNSIEFYDDDRLEVRVYTKVAGKGSYQKPVKKAVKKKSKSVYKRMSGNGIVWKDTLKKYNDVSDDLLKYMRDMFPEDSYWADGYHDSYDTFTSSKCPSLDDYDFAMK